MSRRADLDPLTRAVSDTLDELLFRGYGISTSWSNPEWFITWLEERGYAVTAVPDHAEVEELRAAVEAVLGKCERRLIASPDRVLQFWVRELRAALGHSDGAS